MAKHRLRGNAAKGRGRGVEASIHLYNPESCLVFLCFLSNCPSAAAAAAGDRLFVLSERASEQASNNATIYRVNERQRKRSVISPPSPTPPPLPPSPISVRHAAAAAEGTIQSSALPRDEVVVVVLVLLVMPSLASERRSCFSQVFFSLLFFKVDRRMTDAPSVRALVVVGSGTVVV